MVKEYAPSVVNAGRAQLKDVLEESTGVSEFDSGIIIDYLLDNDYLSDKFFVEVLEEANGEGE